jgi:hypothetical protein
MLAVSAMLCDRGIRFLFALNKTLANHLQRSAFFRRKQGVDS